MVDPYKFVWLEYFHEPTAVSVVPIGIPILSTEVPIRY